MDRECLAIDVAGKLRARRVVDVLARLASVHGAPRFVRSDNGPELVSKALLRWVTDEKIETAFIDPGKPWQNGTDESFNGRFRDECLSLEWFRSRREAAVLIEGWRRRYNGVRPHSSLGYLTPWEFKKSNETKSNQRGATSQQRLVLRSQAGHYLSASMCSRYSGVHTTVGIGSAAELMEWPRSRGHLCKPLETGA